MLAIREDEGEGEGGNWAGTWRAGDARPGGAARCHWWHLGAAARGDERCRGGGGAERLVPILPPARRVPTANGAPAGGVMPQVFN